MLSSNSTRLPISHAAILLRARKMEEIGLFESPKMKLQMRAYYFWKSRSLHLAQNSRLIDVLQVNEDIISRMTVQGCAESFLIKVMSNETDATAKDEQPVEGTNLWKISR